MILGYIRVSKNKQLTALQDDAMRQIKCDRTFTDKMNRPPRRYYCRVEAGSLRAELERTH